MIKEKYFPAYINLSKGAFLYKEEALKIISQGLLLLKTCGLQFYKLSTPYPMLPLYGNHI